MAKFDLKGMPVKAVYTNFNTGEHWSLFQSANPYSVRYFPQIWTRAIFPDSRLFMFANLMSAMKWNDGIRNPYHPKKYRAIGTTLWFCEVEDLQLSGDISNNCSGRSVERYWSKPNNPYSNIPGTLSARRIMLTHLVDVDSWEQAKHLLKHGIVL